MALFPPYRGKGIGSRFLKLAEEKSRERKLPKMSLIVFEQNKGALRLYQRNGYREAARRPVVSYPQIRCTGNALQRVKEI